MARIKKKGQAGNARNFITRNQAIRKLQIPLADFRKLCIWKGIFPREPRSRKKANKSATASTTFYYTKDIQYLLHEPLLQKFRDQKVLEKKISRALGRGDLSDAKRLEGNANRPEKTGKPAYTLNHVIRERYPTFIDALRDLDDCLSMLFLFANLPSTDAVPAKMIARCERLCLEFQHYLIVSHSLRKSFLSIKGIYYQANIQGEEILWLVPYKFNQRIVGDIDFRIMGTFVEFYMTLLGFVNYRLYTSFGLKYPPKFDQTKDDEAGELGAFTIESEKPLAAIEGPKEGDAEKPNPKVQEKVNELLKDMKEEEAAESNEKAVVAVASGEEEEDTSQVIDKFEPVAAGGDILHQPSYSSTNPGSLFANCTFFLSRETPRASLEFILKSFGCKRIGWDEVLGSGAFTHDERDPRITHHVVDRPVIRAAVNDEGDGDDNQTSQKLPPNMRIPGRVYIQPQWVWDSINAEEQLPVNDYVPGATLPPHLSPFVKSAPGQYDPTIPLEEQEPKGEALQEDEDEDEEYESDPDREQEADDEPLAVKDIDVDMDMGIAGSDDEDEVDDDKDSFGGFSDVEEEESHDEGSTMQQHKKELEAELKGKALNTERQDPKAKAKADARKKLAAKAKEEAAELERRKGMMSKKKRKLYEKMEYGRNKQDAEAQKLRAKRRKIEKQVRKKV